jgi:hypothetical protein
VKISASSGALTIDDEPINTKAEEEPARSKAGTIVNFPKGA